MKSVAVLGCGPAGLVAAQGVELAGHKPVIYSHLVPSVIGGAQYLHEAVPKLTTGAPDGTIQYVYRGTKTGYAKKIYGNPAAPVSWGNKLAGFHPCWNLRRLYEAAWEKFEGDMVEAEINFDRVEHDFLRLHDAVFSCIPAPVLCHAGHNFTHQDVWITPEEGGEHLHNNTIVYNGEAGDAWYRRSKIFDVVSTEWPAEVPAPRIRIRKPLRTDCVCLPQVIRLGRYGAWSKPLLVNDAFQAAYDAASLL